MGDRTSEINPNHCKLIIEQHLPALIATVQKNSKRLKPLCSAMSELGHIELSPVQLTQGGQGVNSLLDLGLILGFTELSDVGSVPLNSEFLYNCALEEGTFLLYSDDAFLF